MNMRMGKHWWLPGLLALTLTGCATYPVTKNIREQARPLTLSQVRENPGAVRGTVVIWGGRIIKTVNDTNGADIYVLKLPLNRRERPRSDMLSSGRFIATSQNFLDPQIYRRGRLITVAGTITGVETHALQKTQYPYPVVAARQLHVWPRERVRYYYPGYNYPVWGYPYPGYSYWGYSPPWGVGFNWYYDGGDWDDGGWHYHRR